MSGKKDDTVDKSLWDDLEIDEEPYSPAGYHPGSEDYSKWEELFEKLADEAPPIETKREGGYGDRRKPLAGATSTSKVGAAKSAVLKCKKLHPFPHTY